MSHVNYDYEIEGGRVHAPPHTPHVPPLTHDENSVAIAHPRAIASQRSKRVAAVTLVTAEEAALVSKDARSRSNARGKGRPRGVADGTHLV